MLGRNIETNIISGALTTFEPLRGGRDLQNDLTRTSPKLNSATGMRLMNCLINKRPAGTLIFTCTLSAVAALVLTATPAWAQVPPAPTTTFNQTINTDWLNGGNWTPGVPTGADDAKIDDGKTAFYDQQVNGDPAFGTLTLGVNSTLQFKAGNNQGIPTGKDVYFSDGSVLEYTAGSSNRDPNFFVLPDADATWKTASNTFFRGTLQGAGDFTVEMSGTVESRVEAANFTGHLTYESDNGSTRHVSRLGRFGGTTSVGSGGATFSDDVFVTQERGDRMHDDATVTFSGAGGSDYKWSSRGGNETISNLIIESPNQSGPYLITGNGTNSTRVRVTDTAIFQGTAGTVEIESNMSGEFGGAARVSGVDIFADNLLFQGTGEWTIDGSLVTTNAGQAANYAPGSIGIANGGDVTTNTDATVNAAFDAPSGFTKLGAGTLTLNYMDPVRTVQGGTQNFNPKGIVNVDEGTLALGGNASLNGTTTINVATGGRLLQNSSTALTVAPTLNGAGSGSKAVLGGTGLINTAVTLDNLGDTLSPGNSPGIMPFGTSQTWASFTYEWETNDWNGDIGTGTGVAGTDFDQITIDGTLDLTGGSGSYVLEIISLDGADMPGDVVNFDDSDQSWNILTTTGGITGFDVANWTVDASNFTNTTDGTFTLEEVGNNLVLNFSAAAVPEPASLALWGLVGLGLASFRYFRRRKS
jgi:hypothetical protein